MQRCVTAIVFPVMSVATLTHFIRQSLVFGAFPSKVQPCWHAVEGNPSAISVRLGIGQRAIREMFMGHFGCLTTSLLCCVSSYFSQNAFKGLNMRPFCNFNQDLESAGLRSGPALFAPRLINNGTRNSGLDGFFLLVGGMGHVLSTSSGKFMSYSIYDTAVNSTT